MRVPTPVDGLEVVVWGTEGGDTASPWRSSPRPRLVRPLCRRASLIAPRPRVFQSPGSTWFCSPLALRRLNVQRVLRPTLCASCTRPWHLILALLGPPVLHCTVPPTGTVHGHEDRLPRHKDGDAASHSEARRVPDGPVLMLLGGSDSDPHPSVLVAASGLTGTLHYAASFRGRTVIFPGSCAVLV